jgi:uncharacterized protein YjiS (DUF1127 family)
MKRMEGLMMITQSWQHGGATQGAGRLGLVRRICDGAAATAGRLATWVERVRQRDLLMGLDERMLRDIGLTPDVRTREVTKPFWRE